LSIENINDQLLRFSTYELENMVAKFPYFHQAHLLLAKKYQQENHPRFDEQLQMAALYTQDREVFYSLFNDVSLSSTSTAPSDFDTAPPHQEIDALAQAVDTNQHTTTEPEETTSTSIKEKFTEEITIHTAASDNTPNIKVPSPEMEQEATFEAVETVVQIPTDITRADASTDALANERDENNILYNQADEENTTSAQQLAPEEEEPTPEAAPAFSLQSPHTFDEWLSVFADSASLIKSIQSHQTPKAKDAEEETTEHTDELEDLILQNVNSNLLHEKVEEETHYSKGLDRFIEEQVKRRKQKTAAPSPTEPVLVTETLAKLYEAQHKYVKAISTYELLTLKFPEKKGLFAARIEKLKKLL